MKTFKTLLQNACEDYLTNLESEPTITDIAEMCNISVSDVIWKAYTQATENRKHLSNPSKTDSSDPIINGLRQSQAKGYLVQYAGCLLRHPVGNAVNAIAHLFKMCNIYGFKFTYGTKEGTYESLQHSSEDKDPITGFSIVKK